MCDTTGKTKRNVSKIPLTRSLLYGPDVQSNQFVLKKPDHPFLQDLLELAALVDVPIPEQLGSIIIHMLTENVAPLGIRTILHKVLQNCHTKRAPQGSLIDSANNTLREYDEQEKEGRYGYSMATRYLIDNCRLIDDSQCTKSDYIDESSDDVDDEDI